MSTPVYIAIVIAVGIVASLLLRDSDLKAPWTIMTIALLIALGIGVISYGRTQSDRRTADDKRAQLAKEADNKRAEQIKAHNDCITAADKRNQYRSQTLQGYDNDAKNLDDTQYFYDVIDAGLKTTKFTAEPLIPGKPSLRDLLAERRADLAALRADLDVKSKALNPADCPPLP